MKINSNLSIPDIELEFTFNRASGPGGQNINKVSTNAQLRFDVRHTPSLPLEIKERLSKLAGSRLTQDGVLVIEAKRYRTQEQNRREAEARLVALILKALVIPKIRKPTRPGRSANAERLGTKRRRGAIKYLRRSKLNHEE